MSSLAAQLNSTTVLTPKERERSKTAQQRAEDVIYTLNHTFTCLTLTDLVIVPVLRGFGMNVGHGHAPKPASHDSSNYTFAPEVPSPEKPKGIFGKLMEKDAPSNETARYGDICSDPNHPSAPHTHENGKVVASTYHSAAASPIKPMNRWQRIKGEMKHALGHFSWSGARNWFVGEAIGDIGAAFVTIPLQRFAPGFMNGIRQVIEPVAGGFFRRGAERAAHKWADKHGLDYNHQEVVARAQELYDYEMRHLPQMAAWTVSSILLHFGAMKALEPAITIGQFARQKAATSAITAAVVFATRAAVPDKAHAWDATAGKHVVVPLTKTVGKLFGVKERDVDAYHARQREDAPPQSWVTRVQEPDIAAVNMAAARGA